MNNGAANNEGSSNNNGVEEARSIRLKGKANDRNKENKQLKRGFRRLTMRRKKEFDPTISKWRVYNFMFCTILINNKALGQKLFKKILMYVFNCYTFL
jgi:hypothetical protein